jgi:hypothetical protein
MGDFVLSCGGWVAEEHEWHYITFMVAILTKETPNKKGQGRIVECARKSQYKVCPPGVVGAVVGVDGESGIIAYKTAGHLDGIESARLKLRQKLTVETVNIVHVAKEGGRLLGTQRSSFSFVPPKVQITLGKFGKKISQF